MIFVFVCENNNAWGLRQHTVFGIADHIVIYKCVTFLSVICIIVCYTWLCSLIG